MSIFGQLRSTQVSSRAAAISIAIVIVLGAAAVMLAKNVVSGPETTPVRIAHVRPAKPASDKKPPKAAKKPKVTRRASETRGEDPYDIIASRNLFRRVRLEELAAQPSAPKLPPLLPMPVAPIPPPGPPPRPGSETDSFKKNIAFTGLVETSAGTQALLENLANKEFCFVSRGDNAFGCRVVSISPKSVSLEKDGAPFTLSLGENKPDVEATAPPKPSGGAPPPGEQKPGQPKEK